jgi:hypothetical protein
MTHKKKAVVNNNARAIYLSIRMSGLFHRLLRCGDVCGRIHSVYIKILTVGDRFTKSKNKNSDANFIKSTEKTGKFT